MAVGINMGRKCPWTKEEVVAMYNKVDTYAKMLTVRILREEGQKSAMETMAAYNMFKYPVVYLFIHYHYGVFEDLKMNNGDVSSYIMLLPMIKNVAQNMIEGMKDQNVFYYDRENAIAPTLIKMCEEVIFIEENC